MPDEKKMTARDALKLFDDLAAAQSCKRADHVVLQDAVHALAAVVARDEKAAEPAIRTVDAKAD